MINIEILGDTIDPAGLQRQVATQIDKIKSMIANVSENDDQYRELYIAIRMVCYSFIWFELYVAYDMLGGEPIKTYQVLI